MNFLYAKFQAQSVCHYLVINIGQTWWVDREGKACGPCASKDDAIRSARRLVQLFGDPARPADLWAPDDLGKMKLIWKSKVDA